jgi:hypothetical protein
MTTKRPLDRIGGLKKPTAAADEPAVLDLGRVDAAVEPVASRRGFFRGLLNSGVAAGAASTLVGCGGGGWRRHTLDDRQSVHAYLPTPDRTCRLRHGPRLQPRRNPDRQRQL